MCMCINCTQDSVHNISYAYSAENERHLALSFPYHESALNHRTAQCKYKKVHYIWSRDVTQGGRVRSS